MAREENLSKLMIVPDCGIVIPDVVMFVSTIFSSLLSVSSDAKLYDAELYDDSSSPSSLLASK